MHLEMLLYMCWCMWSGDVFVHVFGYGIGYEFCHDCGYVFGYEIGYAFGHACVNAILYV